MIEIGSNLAGVFMFKSIIILMIVGLSIIIIGSIFGKSRTRRYREAIADLYVACKIRRFSEEDELDLNAEYENLKKWFKSRRMENMSLDESIEEELQERIQNRKPKEEKKE